MLECRRSLLLRLVVLPLMLVAFLSACHKWVPLEQPVAQTITRDRPSKVRLTIDDERVIISNPAVVSDSIVGRSGGKRIPGEPVLSRYALDDIQGVEEERTKGGATMWAFVGGLVGLLFVAVAVSDFGSFGP